MHWVRPGLSPAPHRVESCVEDPVTTVEMLYPLNDSVETPPVKLFAKINVRQGGAQLFNVLYGETSLCFEVDNATLGCSAIRSTRSQIQIQQLGSFSVRAYLSDVSSAEEPVGQRYWLSPAVGFTVMEGSEFTDHLDMRTQARRNRLREGYDLSLLEWATLQQSQRDESLLKALEQNEVGLHFADQSAECLVLLIGIKPQSLQTSRSGRRFARLGRAKTHYLMVSMSSFWGVGL